MKKDNIALELSCEHCGSRWRVMNCGRIDFFPKSMTANHVCDKCMSVVLKKAKDCKKPAKKEPAKKEEE